MNRKRWQEIERLYNQARELAPDARASFLDEACVHDEDLRKEVDGLLASRSEIDHLMEDPAMAVAAEELAWDQGQVQGMFRAGQIIAHYHILGELGRGGMGVVYRAEDTRLKRSVALKALPHAFAADPERLARFEREARILASLNHPNVATIHGLEEVDGSRFIVLEMVEGETLEQRLARRTLPIPEALDFCRQVAEGMESAHAKGIIHRDLKPGNVMVSPEGRIKLLDFGLAKAFHDRPTVAESPTVSEATRPGLMLGTAAYMSPEQAKGKPVDKRTDIWAFGCLLYECVTGKRAFQGDSVAETIAAILRSEPDWTLLPAATPPGVRDLLLRCLEKDPDERLHDIADARIELKKSLAHPATKVAHEETADEQPILVVLPFDDKSPAGDSAVLADGISDKVRGDLSHLETLKVFSKTTAEAFKEARTRMPVLAKEYKVRYVVSGSLLRTGHDLRIRAQLIDARNDTIQWDEEFPGTTENIFDTQDKVSLKIVQGLKLKLTPAEEQQLALRPIPNYQAYDCYLRARNLLARNTLDATNEALQLLRAGLDLTGDNALLYAGLGSVYWTYAWIGTQQDTAIAQAEEYAKRALNLNPETGQAHTVRGAIEIFRGNQRLAAQYFKQALAIDRDDFDALVCLVVIYNISGKPDKSKAVAKRIREINPLDPDSLLALAGAYWAEGQFARSAEFVSSALKLRDVPYSRFALAYMLVGAGRYEEARDVLRPIEASSGQDTFVTLCRLLSLALHEEKEKVPGLMSPSFIKTVQRDPASSIWVADSYGMLREWDKALDWLEVAVKHGFINYPYLTQYDPFLVGLRSNLGFQRLMDGTKVEWEQFEE